MLNTAQKKQETMKLTSAQTFLLCFHASDALAPALTVLQS